MTKEELLEKAKRDYPVGTKFKSMIYDTINSVVYGKTIWYDQYVAVDGNYVFDSTTNKWAEIVSRPEPEKWEPKAGDWVVSLENRDDYRKVGDVFKIHSLGVSCDVIYYSPHTNGSKDSFRPALPHEIPQEEVEYWELLEGFDSHHTGEIFHTKNPLPNYEFWNWKSWSEILSKQPKYFKPSTRQAYEAQQRVEFAIKVTNEVINNVSQINQSKNEKTKCNTKITIQDLISCGEDYSFPTGKRRTGAKIQLEGCVLPSKSRPIRG
jgi:hypothetical protein